jgi:hypothetical protein
MEEIIKSCGDDSECANREMSRRERLLTEQGKLPHVSWEKIVEHIDHVVRLVGADHVGLGSDFDGASMPDGMEDCSKLPKITEALLRKGYSEDDVRKILGRNLLRVMELAEQVSRTLRINEGQSPVSPADKTRRRPKGELRRDRSCVEARGAPAPRLHVPVCKGHW